MAPMFAVTVALIPFAALIGPLVWMARMSSQPGFRRSRQGNRSLVRGMFAAYWVMIVGGLVLWIGVGLVVD